MEKDLHNCEDPLGHKSFRFLVITGIEEIISD